MGHPPTCPRCGGSVRAPGLWSSTWECAEHGSVAPYHVMQHAGVDELEHVAQRASVPVWLATGNGTDWACRGIGYAGDEREQARAAVTVASGWHPVGGEIELLIVAEEPGVGLGARLAGSSGIDPGVRISSGEPDGRVVASRHPTALWPLDATEDRAVFVGEALGCWLWVVVWPALAGLIVYDGLELVDHREPHSHDVELTFGTVSEHLAA